MFDVSGRLAVFANQDDVELAGFAVGPERPQSGLGVIYLHGKGGNFYTGPGRFLSLGLADEDCLHLSMNMRCHDIGYTRYDMEPPDISVGGAVIDGGAWERTAEGYKDIDAGIAYLREHGCDRIVLAGHSSGGLYTGIYEDSARVIVGRVFLSPLMTSRTAFQVWFSSDEQRAEVQELAEQMVADGRSEHLIPLPSWYYGITPRALLERIHEPEDYFAAGCATWSCPTLGVWGGLESRVAQWTQVFDGLAADRPVRTLLIPETGHHYYGYENLVVEEMRAFLDELSSTADVPAASEQA
jgi:pimeloyl-ACP methyl ester carboxylesterase